MRLLSYYLPFSLSQRPSFFHRYPSKNFKTSIYSTGERRRQEQGRGCSVKHLVDAPLDRQQIIDPPLALLALGVPNVLLGKQILDLRCQCLDGDRCYSTRATTFSSAIRRFVWGSTPPDFFAGIFLPPFGVHFHSERVNTRRPSNGFLYAVSVGG